MLSTLVKYNANTLNIIQSYKEYTEILYNKEADGSVENIKKVLSNGIDDLLIKLLSSNDSYDDNQAWLASLWKDDQLKSMESDYRNAIFLGFIYGLQDETLLDSFDEIIKFNAEDWKILASYGIIVSDVIDDDTGTMTFSQLDNVLNENDAWNTYIKGRSTEEQKAQSCKLFVALKLAGLLKFDDLDAVISWRDSIGKEYWGDIKLIVEQILAVKDRSADLTGYSYAVPAYLLATKNITDVETQEEINPGNKFQQEVEYRHIGEAQQFSAKLTHVNESHSDYKSTLKSFTDNAGHKYLLDMPYGSGRNYDGEDWTLQLFNSQDIDVKNSWQYYVMGSYQSASTGGIHRYYGGLGYTHCFDKQQKAYFLLNHGEERGQRYDWRLGKWNSSRYLNSVIIGYDYRLDDRSELKAKLERYRIHGSSADSYHGWKMSLMWNRSF